MKIHNGWLANGVTVGAHLLRNGVHGLTHPLPTKNNRVNLYFEYHFIYLLEIPIAKLTTLKICFSILEKISDTVISRSTTLTTLLLLELSFCKADKF